MRLDLGRWREFGLGLAVGLSVSVAVLVWQNYREKTAAKVAAEKPKPDTRAAFTPETDDPSRNFDFYDRLRNIEVPVPDRSQPVTTDREPPPSTISRPGFYVIQAGSFRSEKDAERVKAQLLKLSIESKVVPAVLDQGEVFRVRIGPLSDLDEINRLRRQLSDADFESKAMPVGE